MKKTSYKQGSEWRKWDLHIHSKFSQENTAKLDIIDIFKKSIENKLSVISITDHTNVDNLDEIWSVWETKTININGKEHQIKNKINFLPGIELHTTSGKHGIHLICIFPKYIKGEKVNSNFLKQNFLAKINASESDIKESGKGDYNTGLFNHPVDLKETCTRTHKLGGLAIVHAGFKSRGIEKEISHATKNANIYEILNSLGTEKEKIIKNYIDICEIPNRLKKNINEANFYKKSFKKPTILCSDSHTTINGKHFTWIKANPNFKGLKQIIEETGRTSFKKTNPKDNISKTTIKTVNIKNSSNFLVTDQRIKLNRDMISIIGGKGTGKSLLLSIINYINADTNKEELVDRVKEPISKADFVYEVQSKDKSLIKYKSSIDTPLNNQLPIYYLRQEELADIAKDKDSVRDLVLQEIGIQDISSNYNETTTLITSKIQIIFNENQKIKNQFDEFKKKYFSNNDKIEINNFEGLIDVEIEKLKQRKDKLSTPQSKTLIEKISKIIDFGTKIKNWNESKSYSEIKTQIETINQQIDIYNKTLSLLVSEPNNLIKINEKDFSDKHILNIEKTTTLLKKLRTEFQNCKNDLSKLGIKEDITALTSTLEKLQQEISTLENTKTTLSSSQDIIKKNKEELSLLFDKSNQKSIRQIIKSAQNQIENQFSQFIDKNKDSKFFTTIFSNINISGEIYFNHKSLLNELKKCLYSTFNGDISNEIFNKDISHDKLFDWISDTNNGVWQFIEKNKKHIKDGNNEEKIFIQTLFEKWFSYIKVQPKIVAKFGCKTKTLENMSTGEQSTLLLKLFLSTKGQQAQIILLDQPEDHIDNDFITSELIDLLKIIKKFKQLIIATHNANIVVGSDSEQVIIARLDQTKQKKQEYLCGSLENEKIRKSIVNILEGGKDAFKKRGKKYGVIKLYKSN